MKRLFAGLFVLLAACTTPTEPTKPQLAVAAAVTNPIHTGDVDLRFEWVMGPNKKPTAFYALYEAEVHDSAHQPVPNVEVVLVEDFTILTSTFCYTDATGRCWVSVSRFVTGKAPTSFRVHVASIWRADAQWKNAFSHDPDGDSDGSTLILPTPWK